MWGPLRDVTWEKAVFWVKGRHRTASLSRALKGHSPRPHTDGGPTDDLQCWELAPHGSSPSSGGSLIWRKTPLGLLGGLNDICMQFPWYWAWHQMLWNNCCKLHFFWGVLCHEACRILAPQLGIEPVLSAMETRSLKQWTTKEACVISIFTTATRIYYCTPIFQRVCKLSCWVTCTNC